MATTHTKPSPKRKQPAKAVARRKPARSAAARRKTTPSRSTTTPKRLPGWKDLGQPTRRGKSKVRTLKRDAPLPTSTARFLGGLLVVVTACTLYVGHIYDTQDLYAEVQQMRRQNMRLHLKHNRLKGAFDRATGPKTIYQRARPLGLKEDFTYGPLIQLDR